MTRAKKSKRCKRKPPRSPLKDWRKRSPSFGKVKDLGEDALENIEKRSVLKFLRLRHPTWSDDFRRARSAWATGSRSIQNGCHVPAFGDEG